MIEEGRFTEGGVDVDDWKRKTCNANSDAYFAKNAKKMAARSRLGVLNDKLHMTSLRTALTHFHS